MKAIVNAKVVLPDRVCNDGMVLMEDGKILYAGDAFSVPGDCAQIDAQGRLVSPGFVDIHCHAGGEWWCWDDPEQMARVHLEGGTTSLDCTISPNIGDSGIMKAIADIRTAMAEKRPGNIMGIHLEGPYMNPNYGGFREYFHDIDEEEYKRYFKQAAGTIRLITVAPELANSEKLIKDCVAEGITVAIGHSEASPEQVFAAADAGATVCTHLMDATGTTRSPLYTGGTKDMSFDEAVMLRDDVMCEIINDSLGIHVRKLMTQYIKKAVGLDRIIAVTDACTGSLDDMDINMLDGALIGSKMRMFQAAKNFKHNTLLEPWEVSRVCSLNPARAVHLDREVGSLEPGKRANIIITDDDYNIFQVILDGETVVSK